MKPLTILVDADDVIENLLDCWVAMLNNRYGTSTSIEDVTDWNVSLAFPTLTKEQVYSVLADDELWNMLEPIPDAQETLQKFHSEGHEIYIVTASDYRSCKAKFDRILSLFPWLDWDHVIVTSNKQMVKGDILIDDNPHNLVGGDYIKMLFDRPHNRSFDAKANGMIRVRTWEEVDFAVQLQAKMATGNEQQKQKQSIFGGGLLW